jgi:hypothetical protein
MVATKLAMAVAIASNPSDRNGIGDNTMDNNPHTVAIGIAGSARMFATIPYTGTYGENERIMGWHAMDALNGIATATAIGVGIHLVAISVNGLASNNRPNVAETDSAKPIECDSVGSNINAMRIAAQSAVTPATGRPHKRTASPIAAMMEERITLGSGPTTTTKPARATPLAVTRAHSGARQSAAIPNASPTTIAQFEPLTAMRWVKDVTFMASDSDSGMASVFPKTKPGTRDPASPGHRAARIRKSS